MLVQEMDYVPDAMGRSMGGISEPVIGLLINELLPSEPSGAVYGFLSGVCHACKDNNVEFLLIATDTKSQEDTTLKRLCLSKGLNGLVCSGFRLDDPFVRQMAEIEIPCACIDIRTGHPNVLDITIDNVKAADEAVSFLVQSGRKNTALIYGNRNADVSNLRVQGYYNALQRAGLPVMEGRMVAGEFLEDSAYQKTKELLARDKRIDSFFCVSDLMAMGTCRAIEEAGLVVGRDIAVVGFDDIPTAQYVYGGLTTIRQNFYAMGYLAGIRIYERISPKKSATTTDGLMYELVIRGSAPAVRT